MRVLVLGGTRFIGPPVVRALAGAGHAVTVFHRGETRAGPLPAGVGEVLGDRAQLRERARELRALAPDVVLHMCALSEPHGRDAVEVFAGVASRLVLVSSVDVYRVEERLWRTHPGPPDPVPLRETSPLREHLYPYRGTLAKGPEDKLWDYDKIPIERAVLASVAPRGTVLRLPAVYGPGDYQRRVREYLEPMDAGRRVILLDARHARWRWTRGYVDDVADAIVRAVLSPRAAGRVYNVGEPDGLREAEWVRAIGRAAGWRGRVVAMARDDLPAALREEAAKFDFRHHWVCDTRRVRRELGFREIVGRDAGLARAVAWERANPPPPTDASTAPPRDYRAEDAALRRVQRRRARER